MRGKMCERRGCLREMGSWGERALDAACHRDR